MPIQSLIITVILCLYFYCGGCLTLFPSVDGSADVADAMPLETIWLFENVFFEVES
jgi:hypothetical protein